MNVADYIDDQERAYLKSFQGLWEREQAKLDRLRSALGTYYESNDLEPLLRTLEAILQ